MIRCDNCGKELNGDDRVFWVMGLVIRCCSLECLVRRHGLKVYTMTAQDVEQNDKEMCDDNAKK